MQVEHPPAHLVRDPTQQVVGEQHREQRQPVTHDGPPPHAEVTAACGEQRDQDPEGQHLAAGREAGQGGHDREGDDHAQQQPSAASADARVGQSPRRELHDLRLRRLVQLRRHAPHDMCRATVVRLQCGALVITGAFFVRGRP